MEVITPDNFLAFISKGITLIYCWHEQCGPCKHLGPLLDEMEPQYPELRFGKLNVRKQQELYKQLHIMFTPQIIVHNHGEFRGKIILQEKEQLSREFRNLIEHNGDYTDFQIPDALKRTNLDF